MSELMDTIDRIESLFADVAARAKIMKAERDEIAAKLAALEDKAKGIQAEV